MRREHWEVKVRVYSGLGNRLFAMRYCASATLRSNGVIACSDEYAYTERRAVRRAVKAARKRYATLTTPPKPDRRIEWSETVG